LGVVELLMRRSD